MMMITPAMKETLDEGLIPSKPPKQVARRALMLLVGSFICGVIIEVAAELSASGLLGLLSSSIIIAATSLVAAVCSFWSLSLSMGAFMPPSEKGVLKYFTIIISACLSLFFGAALFLNALKLLRDIFRLFG
jgi:hypothetical protein